MAAISSTSTWFRAPSTATADAPLLSCCDPSGSLALGDANKMAVFVNSRRRCGSALINPCRDDRPSSQMPRTLRRCRRRHPCQRREDAECDVEVSFLIVTPHATADATPPMYRNDDGTRSFPPTAMFPALAARRLRPRRLTLSPSGHAYALDATLKPGRPGEACSARR